MKKLSCAEARGIDLVEYLASLGYQAIKTRGSDHWYISPFRNEITPSFKVNQKENIFYDHGSGRGGNIIDFGILYHKCSVSQLLDRLSNYQPKNSFLFQPQGRASGNKMLFAVERKEDTPSRIEVVDARSLKSISLLAYLEKRCIPVSTASLYCQEVDFLLYGKKQTVIGFQNDSGGYELRSESFKGSSSPKASTFLKSESDLVNIFEGFFDFLSYQVIFDSGKSHSSNSLILNSLVFFKQAKDILDRHEAVHLYLDRDTAGLKCTAEAVKSNSKYVDQSIIYGNYKDLNDFIVRNHQAQSLYLKMNQESINKQSNTKRHGRF